MQFTNPGCQLEKSYWEINNNVTTEYLILAPNEYSIIIFHYIHAYLPGKDLQTQAWQLCDSCQSLDLSCHQNTLTWSNSTLLRSVWNTAKRLWKGAPFTWFLNWKASYSYELCQFYLSVSSVLWHKYQRLSHPTVFQPMQEILRDLVVFHDCLILITNDTGRGHCDNHEVQGS